MDRTAGRLLLFIGDDKVRLPHVLHINIRVFLVDALNYLKDGNSRAVLVFIIRVMEFQQL